MTTDTRTTVLYEAAQFRATITALKAAQDRIVKEGNASMTPLNYGRLAEAIDAADNALFNVLNIAYAYLGCDEAKAAIRPALRVEPVS